MRTKDKREVEKSSDREGESFRKAVRKPEERVKKESEKNTEHEEFQRENEMRRRRKQPREGEEGDKGGHAHNRDV